MNERVDETIEYLFGEKINQSDAVELIRKVVFPREERATVGRRIRRRIQYAQEKNRLPRTLEFKAAELFGYLVDTYDDLRKLERLVVGLPMKKPGVYVIAEIGETNIYLKTSMVPVPKDYEALREHYFKAVHRIQQLEREVEELRPYREKYLKKVEDGRLAGKKGGRGRSL